MSEDIRRKMRELEKQVEHHMHLYYDLMRRSWRIMSMIV